MLKDNNELNAILKRLEKGMLDYLDAGATDYAKGDVAQCQSIMQDYLVRMEDTSSKEEAMAIVESTVGALNELNEKCEYALIETEQREDLAEIIIMAGHLKGYNAMNEDITEEWRDW